MVVSLSELKLHLARAKTAVGTGSIDGGSEYILIKATSAGLRVGGRGSALSYMGQLPLYENTDHFSVYIPLTAVDSLSPAKTSDDKMELWFTGGDLHFKTSDATGMVRTVVGMAYCDPYQKVEGVPYVILADGTTLTRCIKFVNEVGKGWTKKLIPSAGEFVQLRVTEDICSLALAPTTADQERAMGPDSATALSVFASDGSRFYQVFEPVYGRSVTEREDTVPVSTLLGTKIIAPLHLSTKTAAALSKVLPVGPLRIHVLYDETQRAKALIMLNGETFIWVRVAMHSYPDDDFNEQLKYFVGDEVATFAPTTAFKKAVTAAAKLPETKDHGLTFRIESGMIHITSPEGGATVRYGSTPADTNYEDAFTAIVSGEGVKSSLSKMKGPITVVLGKDFLALNNLETRSRIVLRVYKQE